MFGRSPTRAPIRTELPAGASLQAVSGKPFSELLTPRGERRQKAVVVARIGSVSIKEVHQDETKERLHPGKQGTERLQVVDGRRPRCARRSVPRACRLSSPPAADPGREQPPCSCRVAVARPVRGLLTPRLSPPLSPPRSHARSRSPDGLNRRPERRSDRSLIARSIHSLDERAANAWISAVEIRGEQEGEHRGEHPSARGVPPPRHLTSQESQSMQVRCGIRPLPPTSISAASC